MYISKFRLKISNTEILHPPNAINELVTSILIKLLLFLFSVIEVFTLTTYNQLKKCNII